MQRYFRKCQRDNHEGKWVNNSRHVPHSGSYDAQDGKRLGTYLLNIPSLFVYLSLTT